MASLLTSSLPKLQTFLRVRAHKELLRHESASDLVQSVCREALERTSKVEFANEIQFRTWLYQLAIGKLVDRKRHHGAAKRGGGAPMAWLHAADSTVASADRSPCEVVIDRERQAAVCEALTHLNALDFEVVSMARFFDLPHKEIARHLGKSEVAVRKILSRALARLASLARATSGSSTTVG